MKSKLTLAVALVLGAAAAGAGSLATGNFMEMDSNKDGFLTMNEMKANKQLAAHMEMMDKNKDHKLSQKEFSSFATGGNN